jgi:uncharacterized membrane protein YjjP (DUF1212 family)
MKPAPDQFPTATSGLLDEALAVLLDFGVAAMRAGNTARRTREWMEMLASSMGLDAVSVSLSLDSITAAARCSGEWAMAMRDLGPAGINGWRIGELEVLAKTATPRLSPRDIAVKLADIDSTPAFYSRGHIAGAIAVASAGFAFLNGSATPEIITAGIGGGIGQWLRSQLLHRQLNQYAVAALSAIAASGTYVVAATVAGQIGFGIAGHPAGFISSVLFLVPGFPLIAGLFDLLQYQTVAALSRLAYGVMVLLVVAFGLSIVIAAAGVDLSPQQSLEVAYGLKILLRGLASLAAGCAFAMLFNNSAPIVFAAGLLALGANELRLLLHDSGMMLAPAAFLGAFIIGIVASLLDRRFNIPRITMIVPPIIIMVPGLYAFEMIALLNRGEVLGALSAGAACGFIIGALAMGLATAGFLIRK